MTALVPKPRPTQFEALVEWEDEMFQLQREASGMMRPQKSSNFKHETHEDRMRRWRQADMCDGLYTVIEMITEIPGQKNTQKKNNVVVDSESEDQVLEGIFKTNKKQTPLKPACSWSYPMVSTGTTPSALPSNETSPKLYPNNSESFETPERLGTRTNSSVYDESRNFPETPMEREIPRNPMGTGRNEEVGNTSEYLRSKEELIRQLTKGMEAVTVPVTIGPVQPVFDQGEIRQLGLTIPLNAEIKKVAEKFYSDLTEIHREKTMMPDLTFNPGSLYRTPMGAESDTESPEKSVEKTDPISKLDVAKLKADLEELIIGTIGPDSLKHYQDDELLFICKSIQWKTKNKYDQLEELAAELEIDLSKQKHFTKHYRLDFTEKDIGNFNTMGRIMHIKDLIVRDLKIGRLK
ncbi:uncharacterized protein LOC144825172 [Lissotriton helveticus]